MQTFAVDVFYGDDLVRQYAVHAEDAESALTKATEYGRDLVGGEVRPLSSAEWESFDPLDFDDELFAERE